MLFSEYELLLLLMPDIETEYCSKHIYPSEKILFFF